MDLSIYPDTLREAAALDPAADAADRTISSMLGPDHPWRAVLDGRWLGHQLHPALTDLPIGFWTTSMVLDGLGVALPRARRLSDLFVGLGLVCVPPTAIAGWIDWQGRTTEDRRVGLVHAAGNAAATGLYGASLWHRARGRRFKGVLYGAAGATMATAAGLLGGHLAAAEVHAAPDADDGQSDAVLRMIEPAR